MPQCGHVAQLYEQESFLFETVAKYLAEGLAAGERLVVLATLEHQREFAASLAALDVDVPAHLSSGVLTMVDARELLGAVLVGDRPDARRFETHVAGLLDRASGRDRRPVRIYGELVDLLWADRQPGVALQIELLWNDLISRRPATVLCAYGMQVLAQDVHGGHFEEICNQHDRVEPAESFQPQPSGRGIEVSRLQQRARALEGEVAQRRQLEWALRDALEARSLAEKSARASREELAVQVDGLDRLHEMSLGLSRTRDLRELLDGVLAAATAVSFTDIGIISLYDEIDGWLEVGASLGFSQNALASIGHIESGAGACGMALKERRRVIVEDVETDPLFTDFLGLAHDVGFRAVHSTPLISRTGDVCGVLTVHYRELRRPSEREQHLIDVCARQAVDLIENARLYGQLRDQGRRRDEFIAALARDLRSPLAALQDAVRQMQATGPPVDQDQTAAAAVDLQVGHFSRLVEDLTDLSRLAATRPDIASATTVSPRVSATKARRILVVDDNIDAAETMALFVGYRGHETRVAHDGGDAVAIASEFKPEIVLLDIGLPTLSGYEVARAIRGAPWASDVKIIAVSGLSSEMDRERSREAGFDLHFVKPIDHIVLERVLQLSDL